MNVDTNSPYYIPKHFNIAGPCNPDEHYMVDTLGRLPEAYHLAMKKKYFCIHSARQSGKTTFIHSLVDTINKNGAFYSVYCSLETLQGYDDQERALPMIIDTINHIFQTSNYFKHIHFENQPHGDISTGVMNALQNISLTLDKPLIIFFDEADCLSGQALIAFLRQLRVGHNRVDITFPWSISLIGMRNIRDYKACVRPGRETLGSSSPFNIITKSLTLMDFTEDQIRNLYQQHTDCTGQVFEKEAIERAYYWSEGQPWLVNALARQVVEDDLHENYSIKITSEHIDDAAEKLILRRDVHIDSLLERLKEPRVKKVIEPILCGGDIQLDFLSDDVQFCLDIGIVKGDSIQDIHISNPIYNEVIIRTLNHITQDALPEL